MQYFVIVVLLAIVGLSLAAQVSGTNKAKQMVETWARQNQCSVVSMRRRYPMFKASKSQRVFRVDLVDPNGHPRQADIICGHWLIGMSSPKIKVDWKS